jgi:uncharacterized damage-inducible protein DinB
LAQLEGVLEQIHSEDFTKPSSNLSGSSVGQHLRHTLEFFVCLMAGFDAGKVNYDQRSHDKSIETDKEKARSLLVAIRVFILEHPEDRKLTLELAYERHNENWFAIETNYHRELVYNIEHAVHHMALMKIGIREVAHYLSLPHDFGIAVSTLRYQEAAFVAS